MKQNRELSVELTSDGSSTIYVPSMDEHYHSVNGARQESNHVFIESGLLKVEKKTVYVLEIGFGTGLNAYLTYLNAEINAKNINYVGVELYPLEIEIIEKLNYVSIDEDSQKNIYRQMHSSEWEQKVLISGFFSLTKIEANLTELNLPISNQFDLIYFDAFAPDKQPEMWSFDIFQYLYDKLSSGGILTTYCAKGIVRRLLQQVGFTVERLPGPPGKREMLRAIKS